MVDRARGRVYVVPAMLARVRLARDHFVMLRNLAARLAENALWVKVILEPLKAGIVSWKIALKVLEGVSDHLRALNFGFAHRSPLLRYLP